MTGVPAEIDEARGYTVFPVDGVCTVALCGNPEINGKEVQFYLTNMTEGDISLRAEVYSVNFTVDHAGNITAKEADKLLGKTDFIHSGEYVETLTLKKALSEPTYVMIKIATYDEATGRSQGSFFVETVLNYQ